MIWSLLLLLVLVLCSGLISGSETALFALTAQDRTAFSLSASNLKHLAVHLMRRPRRVLMTVLIVNTTVNIGIFAVSYITFGGLAATHPGWAAFGGIAALAAVILCGEVVPKALALAHATRIAPAVAPLVEFLQIVTAPLRFLMRVFVVEPITRLIAPRPRAGGGIAADDLSALVALSAQQQIIDPREHDMLQAAVALPHVPVRSIMVPRVDMHAGALDAGSDEIRRIFTESGLKKIPIYGHDVDDLHGLLYARDFYLRREEAIERLLRPASYVPEVVNLLQLIEHFRRTQSQLAIVVDEYGGVSGLVTLEDVLEEFVGELDEGTAQPPAPDVEQVGERSYRLPGTLDLRPWRKALGLSNRFLQVDTLGGAVVAALGRLPQVGDRVHFGSLEVTVEHMVGRRVDCVLVDAPLESAAAHHTERAS